MEEEENNIQLDQRDLSDVSFPKGVGAEPSTWEEAMSGEEDAVAPAEPSVGNVLSLARKLPFQPVDWQTIQTKEPSTWEEAMVAETPAISTVSNLASAYAFGEVQDLTEAQVQFMRQTAVGRVMNAFNQSWDTPIPTLFTEEEKKRLRGTLLNDYEKGESYVTKGILEGVIMQTIESAYEKMMKLDEASQGALYQTGVELYGPRLGRDLALMPEAFAAHPASVGLHTPKIVERAKAAGVLEGESVYSGLQEPSSEQAKAMADAQKALGIEVRFKDEPPKEALDAKQIARNLNPELFDEYDALAADRESLGRMIRDLSDKRRQEALDIAPHTQEIADLTAKMEGANARKKKIYQERIDSLTAANEEFVSSKIAEDTPEIAKAREDYLKADYRMRDLAPEVSKLTREARDISPEIEEFVETPEPMPEPEPMRDEATILGAPQKLDIVEDLKKKLTDLGMTAEEALANATLVKARYENRSKQFGGSLGTAEEMYARDFPEVRAGREAKRKEAKTRARELAQEKEQSLRAFLSAKTEDIEGIRNIQARAESGNKRAHTLLNSIAQDSLEYLTGGIPSVRINTEYRTGLFQGDFEPSLGVSLDFAEADRPSVLASLAKFAENFNQKQVHVRSEASGEAVNGVYPDGSINTPVYRVETGRALTQEEVNKVIEESGLTGVSYDEKGLEFYNAGQDATEFADSASRAVDAVARIAGGAPSYSSKIERLWVYGEGGIPYEGIKGDLRTADTEASTTARRLAEERTGRPVNPAEQAREVTPEQRRLQQKIADAFDELPVNDMANPLVKRAYEELSKEIVQQYKELPIKVEAWNEKGQPYKNSSEMRRDILDNNHLYFFKTEEGFGGKDVDVSGHPLLEKTGVKSVDGHEMVVNDMLRVVHDYYAHSMSPVEFGARGEEAAWQNHMMITDSPWARWALTAETRGQNSWVNFNKGLDESVPVSERPFATQKTALLPIEYSMTGKAQIDAPLKALSKELNAKERMGSLKEYPKERPVPREGVELYQGAGNEAGQYGLPGFYSKMYRSLEEKLNKTGTPDQMKQQVEAFVKSGQFKKDELYWSGLDEYLSSLPKDQKVSKEDILTWLDENKLEISEDIRSINDDRNKGGYTDDDVYIASDGERVDVESEDPYMFSEEVEQYKNMFYEDNGDDAKAYWEKEGSPDEDRYLIIEESEDGTKEISWNEEAIEDDATDRARDYFSEYGDIVYKADVGGAYNYEIRINDQSGEWSVRDADNGREIDSGSGRTASRMLDSARQALWEHLYDNDIVSNDSDSEEGATTYSEYQLEGPKDDYTEMLITLPQIRDKGVRQHGWDANEPVMMHIRFNSRTDADGKSVMFVEEVQSDWHQQGREKGYMDEKAADEINKKLSELNYQIHVLQGRVIRRGEYYYELPEGTPDREIADLRQSAHYERRGGELKSYEESMLEDAINRSEMLTDEQVKAYKDALDKAVDERDAANAEEARLRTGVAKAPFDDMNKYSELGMKRIIAWAVENGFDRVAWTTGEQQAERYSSALQRSVKEIRINPEGISHDGNEVTSIAVDVRREYGNSVSDFIAQQLGKEVTRDGYVYLNKKEATSVFGQGLADDMWKRAEKMYEKHGDWDAKELDNAEGDWEALREKAKEIARRDDSTHEEFEAAQRYVDEAKAVVDRLKEQAPKEDIIEGLDIKISDKGMKEVYDKVLVNIANGIVKKFGTRVKAVEIDTGEEKRVIAEGTEFPTYADIKRTVEAMKHKRDFELKIEEKSRADFFEEKSGLPRAEAEARAKGQMELSSYGGAFTSKDADKLFRTEGLLKKLDMFIERGGEDFKLGAEESPSMQSRIKEFFEGDIPRHYYEDYGIEYEDVPAPEKQWGFDVTDEMKASVGEKGQSLFQAARGKIKLATKDTKAVISLFKSSNASTFMHETGHLWLEELMADSARPDAPDILRNDAQTVRDWLGVKEGEIPRKAHEKFARGFERYLMEGVAPTKELASVFAKFKKWLTDIYRSVQKLNSPINDDIRDVFDRFFTDEPRRTTIAPESEPAKMMADIHKADAKNTPPQYAAEERNRIRQEADELAKLHDPEVYDELTGNATGQPIPTGQTPAVGEPTQPAEGASVASPEPTQVSGGGGGAGAESAGIPVPASEQQPAGAETAGAVATGVPEGEKYAAESGSPSTPLGRPESDLVDKAGNIRLDNLSTPEDVSQVIRDAAAQNDDFMAARRGVVTDDQVLSLADALGMTAKELGGRSLGEAFNAEQIVAARKLLVQSAISVRDLAKKASTGDEQAVMAYVQAKDRHLMIQEQVSGITAEAGRALRAFRKLEGLDDAKALGQFLETNTGRTLNQLQQEAALAAQLDTAQQVSKFMRDSEKPTFKDMILEYWINAILSGPMTHVKNTLGNVLVSVNSIPESFIASMIGEIRKRTGTGDVEITTLEAKARAFGFIQGAKEGMVSAVKAFKDEDFVGNFTLEQPRRKAIPGAAGKVVRLPGRFLSAQDELFKAIGYRQELNAIAYRAASKEGLSGDAFNQRVAEMTMNPTEEVMKQAMKTAEYQTFTNELGATGKRFQNFVNSNMLAKLIFPFIRTPVNILKYAAERTPLGLLSQEIRNNLSGVNGASARDTQAARLAWGTALGVGAIALAADGSVTGAGPSDSKEKAMWRMTGWQPYAVRVGDMYYSYQWMEPFSTIIGISADISDTALHLSEADEEEVGKVAVAAFAALSKNLMSKLSLRGASDLIQAASDPDRYGDRYINNFVASFLPNVSAQTARAADPVLRDAKTLMDTLKSRIPSISEEVLPVRDVWGEPIVRGGSLGIDAYNPIYESQITNDPVNQALISAGVFPSKLRNKIRGVELTPEQYDRYSMVAGRMAKQRLNAVVSLPNFSEIPLSARVKMLNHSVSSARETARAMMMMEYPEIMQQAIDNKQRELQGEK